MSSSSFEFLGVHIDRRLTWNIDFVWTKLVPGNFVMKFLAKYFQIRALMTAYYGIPLRLILMSRRMRTQYHRWQHQFVLGIVLHALPCKSWCCLCIVPVDRYHNLMNWTNKYNKILSKSCVLLLLATAKTNKRRWPHVLRPNLYGHPTATIRYIRSSKTDKPEVFSKRPFSSETNLASSTLTSIFADS